MTLLRLALCFILLGLAPAQAQQIIPSTTNTIAVAGTVAASTRIVTNPGGGKFIYVTVVSLIPVATSVVTFTSGTGTNCGTGTASLTGAMTFSAGQVLNLGDGYGVVLALPVNADLCITIATAAAPGSLGYALF